MSITQPTRYDEEFPRPAPQPPPFWADAQHLSAELAETRDLLRAVLEAIDLPIPAGTEAQEKHRHLAFARSCNASAALETYLRTGQAALMARWLRGRVHGSPATYKTSDGAS